MIQFDNDPIDLTKREGEALLHRLSNPDGLADALTDTHPDDPPSPYEWGEVQRMAWSLHEQIRQSMPKPYIRHRLHQLEVDILVDCIEGSTLTANMSDKSPQAARGAWNALYNLAGKLNQHFNAGIQPGDIPAF